MPELSSKNEDDKVQTDCDHREKSPGENSNGQ